MLEALAGVAPHDELVAFVPGRAAVASVHPRVSIVRHRLPSRILFGTAALTGRPRLARLAGGADVVWLPAPAPVAPGAPYVLTVNDRSWEARPADFTAYERAWHRLARPRALARRAARVVAISGAVADELQAAWGVRSTVISPGLGVAPAGAPPAPGRYLLFVGALEPRKGPDVLVRAFARARARGLDADLVIVGEGRLPVGGPGVRRLGAVGDEELDGLYAGALALVAPSWLEGFGLPALEAAARGVPAVVSDLPVFAETLGAGALRVPVGDEAALADALLAVAGDPALRARLATAAAPAAARAQWPTAARALHALLLEAAR
jgi:glycosyltransferase involved in cell wall biosynthesis